MEWAYCSMTTIHSHAVLIRTGIDLPLGAGAEAFDRIVARLKAEGKHPGDWVSFCVHPLRPDGSLYGGRVRSECSHGWYWIGAGMAPLTYPRPAAADGEAPDGHQG